jgi:hypothetical protein
MTLSRIGIDNGIVTFLANWSDRRAEDFRRTDCEVVIERSGQWSAPEKSTKIEFLIMIRVG